MKRFASHYLFMPDVGFIKQQVVEITDEGVVRDTFPLTEEIEKGEVLFPVLFYPFDFISMQPVDGTRHRLLR